MPASTLSTISAEEANNLLWHVGRLEHLIRPHQLDLYHFLRETNGVRKTKRVVFASRQWGKSYDALVVATEKALAIEEFVTMVTAKSAISLKQFLLPNMRKLLRRCPPDLMPDYNGVDHIFTFRNGATIKLGGADTMRAVDSQRGPAVDLWIVDEAGFIPSDELKSLILDVVLPTFIQTRGRMIVMSSPPKQPGHYLITMRNQAILDDAYIERDIDTIEGLDPRDRAEWARECGGEESDTFQREYKCRIVIDSNLALVPEFASDEKRYIKPVRDPDKYEFLLTSADPGFHPDPAAFIYGYYDFRRAKLVIQSEDLVRKQTTEIQASIVIAKEALLWKERKPWTRIQDVNPQWGADMAIQHKLYWRPVVKDTLEAMTNNLRMWFAQGKIEIDPRCVNLLHQLRTGCWEPNRTAYQRQDDHHCDLVACLVYLVRNVPVGSNPYPNLPEGLDLTRTMVLNPTAVSMDRNAAALASLIPRHEY